MSTGGQDAPCDRRMGDNGNSEKGKMKDEEMEMAKRTLAVNDGNANCDRRGSR